MSAIQTKIAQELVTSVSKEVADCAAAVQNALKVKSVVMVSAVANAAAIMIANLARSATTTTSV